MLMMRLLLMWSSMFFIFDCFLMGSDVVVVCFVI